VSKAQQDIRRKTRALEHAAQTGNVRQTCRYVGIPRSLFYVWKAAYEREGEAGLVNKKPCAHAHPKATAPAIVEQILHLRRTYHLGPIRIAWYLERSHGIRVCDATVSRTLTRHGLNRLPNRVGRRAVHTHRDAKQVPGHHVQVDVKFLTLQGARGQRIRPYQYPAIDGLAPLG
jgi:transposase